MLRQIAGVAAAVAVDILLVLVGDVGAVVLGIADPAAPAPESELTAAPVAVPTAAPIAAPSLRPGVAQASAPMSPQSETAERNPAAVTELIRSRRSRRSWGSCGTRPCAS